MENKVIGAYPVSNCGAVLVYEIGEDRVLAGMSGLAPEWCAMAWEEEDGEPVPGFRLGGMFIPFRDVERIEGGRDGA